MMGVILWIALLCIVVPTVKTKDPEFKCDSSDTLKNVYLENEDKARSHILEDVSSMSECVKNCCQNSTCDLAIIKDDQCHLIGCQDENSCQLSHSKGVDADVTFVTKRKKKEIKEVQSIEIPKKPGNKTNSLSSQQSTSKINSNDSKGDTVKQSNGQNTGQIKQVPDKGENTHKDEKLSDKNGVKLKVNNDGKVEGIEKENENEEDEDKGSSDGEDTDAGENSSKGNQKTSKMDQSSTKTEDFNNGKINKNGVKLKVNNNGKVEGIEKENVEEEDEEGSTDDSDVVEAGKNSSSGQNLAKDKQKMNKNSTTKTEGFNKNGKSAATNSMEESASSGEFDDDEDDASTIDEKDDDSSSDGSADDDQDEDTDIEISKNNNKAQSYDVPTTLSPLTTIPVATVANNVAQLQQQQVQYNVGYVQQQQQQATQQQQPTPYPSVITTTPTTPATNAFQQNVKLQQSQPQATPIPNTTIPLDKNFQQNFQHGQQIQSQATNTISPTSSPTVSSFNQQQQQQNYLPAIPPLANNNNTTTTSTGFQNNNLMYQSNLNVVSSNLNTNNLNTNVQPNQTTSIGVPNPNTLSYQSALKQTYTQENNSQIVTPVATQTNPNSPAIQSLASPEANIMTQNSQQSSQYKTQTVPMSATNDIPIITVKTPAFNVNILKEQPKAPYQSIQQNKQPAQQNTNQLQQVTNRYQQKSNSNENKATPTKSQYGYQAESQQTPTKYTSESINTPFTNLPGAQGVPYRPTSARYFSSSTSTTTERSSTQPTDLSWNATPKSSTKYMPNVDEISGDDSYETTSTSYDTTPTKSSSTKTSISTTVKSTTNYLPNVDEYSGESEYQPTVSNKIDHNNPTPKQRVSAPSNGISKTQQNGNSNTDETNNIMSKLTKSPYKNEEGDDEEGDDEEDDDNDASGTNSYDKNHTGEKQSGDNYIPKVPINIKEINVGKEEKDKKTAKEEKEEKGGEEMNEEDEKKKTKGISDRNKPQYEMSSRNRTSTSTKGQQTMTTATQQGDGEARISAPVITTPINVNVNSFVAKDHNQAVKTVEENEDGLSGDPDDDGSTEESSSDDDEEEDLESNSTASAPQNTNIKLPNNSVPVDNKNVSTPILNNISDMQNANSGVMGSTQTQQQPINLMSQNTPKVNGPIAPLNISGPAILNPVSMQGGPLPAAKEIVINLRLPIRIATTHHQGPALQNSQPVMSPLIGPIPIAKQPTLLQPHPAVSFNQPKPLMMNSPANLNRLQGPIIPGNQPRPQFPADLISIPPNIQKYEPVVTNMDPMSKLDSPPILNKMLTGQPSLKPPTWNRLPFANYVPPFSSHIPFPILPNQLNRPLNSHPFGPKIFSASPKPLTGVFNNPGVVLPGPVPSRLASALRMSPNSPVLIGNRLKTQNNTKGDSLLQQKLQVSLNMDGPKNMKNVEPGKIQEKEKNEKKLANSKAQDLKIVKSTSKPHDETVKITKNINASKLQEQDSTKIKPVNEPKIQTMNVTYAGETEEVTDRDDDDDDDDEMSSSGQFDASSSSGSDDGDVYFNEEKDKRRDETNDQIKLASRQNQMENKEQMMTPNGRLQSNVVESNQSAKSGEKSQVKNNDQNTLKAGKSQNQPPVIKSNEKSIMDVNDEDDEGEVMLYTKAYSKPTNSVASKSASTNQVQTNDSLVSPSTNHRQADGVSLSESTNKIPSSSNSTNQKFSKQTNSENSQYNGTVTSGNKTTERKTASLGNTTSLSAQLEDSLDEAQILKVQAMENLANKFDHGEDSYRKDEMSEVKADLDNEQEEGEMHEKDMFAEKRNRGHVKPGELNKVAVGIPPGGMGKPHVTGEAKIANFGNGDNLPPGGMGKPHAIDEMNSSKHFLASNGLGDFSGDNTGIEARDSGDLTQIEHLPRKHSSEIEDSLIASMEKQNGEKSSMFGKEPTAPKSDQIEGLGGEKLIAKKNDTFVDDNNMFKPVSSMAPNAKLEAVKETISRPSRILTSPTVRLVGRQILLDEIGDKRDNLRKPTAKSKPTNLKMFLGDEFPDGESVSLNQRETESSTKRSDINKDDPIIIGLEGSSKPSDKRSSIPIAGESFPEVANATKRNESPTPDARLPTSKLKGDKRYMINLSGGDSMGSFPVSDQDKFYDKDNEDEQRNMYPSNENDEILEAAESELQGGNSDDFDGFNTEKSSFSAYPTDDMTTNKKSTGFEDARWSFPMDDSPFSEGTRNFDGFDGSQLSFADDKSTEESLSKDKKKFSENRKSSLEDWESFQEVKHSSSFTNGKTSEAPKNHQEHSKVHQAPLVENKENENLREVHSPDEQQESNASTLKKSDENSLKEREVSNEDFDSGSGSGNGMDVSGSGGESFSGSGSDASGSGEVMDTTSKSSENTGSDPEENSGKQRSEQANRSAEGADIKSENSLKNEDGDSKDAHVETFSGSGSGTTEEEEEEEEEETRKRKTEELFYKPLPVNNAVKQITTQSKTKEEDTMKKLNAVQNKMSNSKEMKQNPQSPQQKVNAVPTNLMGGSTTIQKQAQGKQNQVIIAPLKDADTSTNTSPQAISQTTTNVNQNKQNSVTGKEERLTSENYEEEDFDVEPNEQNTAAQSVQQKQPSINNQQKPSINNQHVSQQIQQNSNYSSSDQALLKGSQPQSTETSSQDLEVKSDNKNDTTSISNQRKQTKMTQSNQTLISSLNLIKLVNISAEAFENALVDSEAPAKQVNNTKQQPALSLTKNNETNTDSLKNETTSALDESIIEEVQNVTDTLESHEIRFKPDTTPAKSDKPKKGFAMHITANNTKQEQRSAAQEPQAQENTNTMMSNNGQNTSQASETIAQEENQVFGAIQSSQAKSPENSQPDIQLSNETVNSTQMNSKPDIQISSETVNSAQTNSPQINSQQSKTVAINKESKQSKNTAAETEVTDDEQKDEDELADAVISPLFDYSIKPNNNVVNQGNQGHDSQPGGAGNQTRKQPATQYAQGVEKVPKKGFYFPGQLSKPKFNKQQGQVANVNNKPSHGQVNEALKNQPVSNWQEGANSVTDQPLKIPKEEKSRKNLPSLKQPSSKGLFQANQPTDRPSPLKVLYFPVTEMKKYSERKMRGKNAFPLHESKLLKHVSHFHHNKNTEVSPTAAKVSLKIKKQKKSHEKKKQKKKKWTHQKKHKKAPLKHHNTLHRKVQVHQQMDHQTQIFNQKHKHPMKGHRYGGETYQHTHKMANHDFSKQIGHYGMHDDNYDSHANNDPYAEMSPNGTEATPQQQNVVQQQTSPGRAAVPTKDVSSAVLDKINTFNSLAGHLADNLSNFNRGKGWKPTKDPMWREFVQGQEKLKNLRVERQGILDNMHSTSDKKSCHRGITVRGATLRGGILSGEFHTLGVVKTQKECVDLCCKSKKCDIAMTVGRECINIKCFNKKNCNVAPAGSRSLYRDVLPVTTFVQHSGDEIDRRSEIPHPMTVVDVVKQLEESEEEEIERLINSVNVYP